jgi:hypothetical protein
MKFDGYVWKGSGEEEEQEKEEYWWLLDQLRLRGKNH